MPRMTSVQDLLQLAGDRADLTVANLVAIDRDDRRDLGGSAAHEDFVGDVELCAVDGALDDFEAEFVAARCWMIASRVMLSRMLLVRSGVMSLPSRTSIKQAPPPSETLPWLLRKIATS